MKTRIRFFTLVLTVLVSFSVTAQESQVLHYNVNDVISDQVFFSDEVGGKVFLHDLFGENEAVLNVLFIFGGGDMGVSTQPGRLWCQDSFEDTHILRTLYEKYHDKGVNFIPVASSPIYHTGFLGHPQRVFLDEPESSPVYSESEQAFIESTLASFDMGILPIKPWLDVRFRLMMNRDASVTPGSGYGKVADWQGAFRAENESQFYGVPSFWLIDNNGKILSEPQRGNVYHPHGGEVIINYTYTDLDSSIANLLD